MLQEAGKPIGVKARRSDAAKRSRARQAERKELAAAGSPVDRRQEILRAAARRFAEYGFEASTIREIAYDAHILSGSIYHHFDTKEAMLHAIVREPLRVLLDETVRIAESRGDAEQKLVSLILLSMRELLRDQDAQAILYNERKLFRRREDFAYVIDAKRTMYEAWEAVLRDGIANGQFHSRLDMFLTISTVLRTLNTCADWFRHNGATGVGEVRRFTIDEVVAFNLDFTLRAVRAAGRADEPAPIAAWNALAEPSHAA